MKTPVLFVDGQEAGRLLELPEDSISWQFPKKFDLAAQSLYLFDSEPHPWTMQDNTVQYRIGVFTGTWGSYPVRLGWSEGELPAESGLRHLTGTALTAFAAAARERIRAERMKPAEVVEQGSGPCVLCNPVFAFDPKEPGRQWGRCGACGWLTSKTWNLSSLDTLVRVHVDTAVEKLLAYSREWKAAHPDFDAEENARQILAGLDAIRILLDGFDR